MVLWFDCSGVCWDYVGRFDIESEMMISSVGLVLLVVVWVFVVMGVVMLVVCMVCVELKEKVFMLCSVLFDMLLIGLLVG